MVDSVGVLWPMEIKVSVDDTKTIAELATDVAAIVGLGATLSACGVARQEIRLAVPLLGGVSATPVGDADGEFHGEWNLKNATTHFTESVVVPGLLDTVLVAGKINSANTDVSNWETALTTAAANGTRPEGRDYYPFSAVKSTFLGVRAKQRALHSRSVDKR